MIDIVRDHRGVFNDLLINSCDVTIPAHSLGILAVPDWLPAALGVVSSVASIVRTVDPSYRIFPAA
jgi:hypothetical protein